MEPNTDASRQDADHFEETVFHGFQLVQHRHHHFFLQVKTISQFSGVQSNIEGLVFQFRDLIQANPFFCLRVVSLQFRLMFELVNNVVHSSSCFLVELVQQIGSFSLFALGLVPQLRFDQFEQLSLCGADNFVC